jgi:hypothetical protein
MTKQQSITFLLALPIALFLLPKVSRGFSPSPQQREQVVFKYFDGVNKKDRNQIASCFGDKAIIRDVCCINSSDREVTPGDLADRCMEFLQAHPDCVVDFHYGPTCSHDGCWVFAHWYETGHWLGDSRGIKATGNPMSVEGQTRFFVSDDLKIEKFVVTRTFTEWEETLQKNKS